MNLIQRKTCVRLIILITIRTIQDGRGWAQEKALTFKVQYKDNDWPQKIK